MRRRAPRFPRAPRRNDRKRSDFSSMDRTRAFVDRLIAWSPVLLLGGLAALTYWLDAQVQPPAARRDGTSRHDPDLFLVNFRGVNYDENGKPRESLQATRGNHFPDDETTELAKPHIRIT